jgi:hypothetical protein
VIWYHEEEVIRESERIRLEYTGDRCALTIHNARPEDSGLYKVGHVDLICLIELNLTFDLLTVLQY